VHLGYVQRSELPVLYSCFDVVLFTSMSPFETFGIVNVEAMAAGLPIVHFGVGGVQDYFVSKATDSGGLGDRGDGGMTLEPNSVLVPAFHDDAAAIEVVGLLLNATRRREVGRAAAGFASTVFNSTARVDHTAQLFRCVGAVGCIRLSW
jgi:glycosyltransferase involved in cell wall biosynthesis